MIDIYYISFIAESMCFLFYCYFGLFHMCYFTLLYLVVALLLHLCLGCTFLDCHLLSHISLASKAHIVLSKD